jgi:preprotein translocase subunit YajC
VNPIISHKAAHQLKSGDRLISSTGVILTVTKVKTTETRTIVLFDGDMEIDFDPYCRLPVQE